MRECLSFIFFLVGFSQKIIFEGLGSETVQNIASFYKASLIEVNITMLTKVANVERNGKSIGIKIGKFPTTERITYSVYICDIILLFSCLAETVYSRSNVESNNDNRSD